MRKYAHKAVSALVCAAAVCMLGCHGPGNISYYGIAWTSLTDVAGDYATYIVTIDSVTLTRSDGVVVTAVATPEVVDLTQLGNISELWSSGAIPDGTYVAATITVDYTNAVIAVMVGGQPQVATVLDYSTGDGASTYAITVLFDPANQPTITPTYASTSATRLAMDFDLAASGRVDLSTSPATVYVRPIVSIGVQASDTKIIRVRGPLINSSTNVQTYTVYIRPFYDEANNIGTVTMFSQPNTVYTLNGVRYVGSAGLDALAVLSAGTTTTAGYTTFQTDYNPANGATAGKFNLQYVVAGSTLEDVYTEGISGDVIARTGNTLTLQGATLILTTADTFQYCVADSTVSPNCPTANPEVLLGSGTIVTADDNTTLSGLDYNSVAVGQHITARGVLPSNAVVSGSAGPFDSTGTSATNTGSVRLQPTEVFGSLVSSSTGSLTMNVQSIDNWPVSEFDFAGNGAAAVNPADFLVDSGTIALPTGTAPGDALWVNGVVTPFGSAPPDFDALAVNNQASVQVAGGSVGGGVPTTPGNMTCGNASQVCDSAVLEVIWDPASTAPFVGLSDSGFSLDLSSILSAEIRIGPQVINLALTGTSPTIVPTTLPVTSVFAPRYMVGDPYTSTTTPTVTSTTNFKTYSSFPSFVTEVNSSLSSSTPARQLVAKGVYDPTTNTFTATIIDFVI